MNVYTHKIEIMQQLPEEVLFNIWSYLSFKDVQDYKLYALNRVYCNELYGFCTLFGNDILVYLENTKKYFVNLRRIVYMLLDAINKNYRFALKCLVDTIVSDKSKYFEIHVYHWSESHDLFEFLYNYCVELRKRPLCRDIIKDASDIKRRALCDRRQFTFPSFIPDINREILHGNDTTTNNFQGMLFNEMKKQFENKIRLHQKSFMRGANVVKIDEHYYQQWIWDNISGYVN